MKYGRLETTRYRFQVWRLRNRRLEISVLY